MPSTKSCAETIFTLTHTEPHLAQRLLRECRELLEHDLNEWIKELGPTIAEEVFTLANATRDNAKQSEYLRLRIDLQSRWDTLATTFDAALEKQLQHVKVVASTALDTGVPSELQLVDDRELTERIVTREFERRISEACSEEIYALDRRIAHLTGRTEDDDSENQFGPQIVCSAIRSGCEAMLSDLDSRTVLLRQLERHLISEMPALYRAVNEVLIEAGILPELKRSYRRAVTAGTLAAAADPGNILDTLQRLAQAHQQQPGGIAADPASVTPGGSMPQGLPVFAGGGGNSSGGSPSGQMLPPGAIAVSAEFLHSLQAFQGIPTAAPGDLTNVVRMARDSEAARQVPPLEAITIDIVSTLFDLIFDDEKVPAAVKGLVSRLQIPVLKVAILDPQFFADRSHPSRRFLDSISGIAIRWGDTVDEGDPFYRKLAELVERIQDTFDENIDVFSAAITELAAFVTEREAMENETSQVVAEAVQRKEDEKLAQRERHAAARQAADNALTPLLTDTLPRPVAQFLRGHWRAVLQKLALTAGEDHPDFQNAARIAGDLAWSVAPKQDADERRRLVALLPTMLSGLHQGLDQLGTSSEARRPLLDALVALHSAALRADIEAQTAVPDLEEEAAPATPPTVTLQVNHVMEGGIDIEEVALPENEDSTNVENAQDRSILRRVKHLVRGDWVEFFDDEGESRRERLTWISPRRTLYLFSNHANKCAISISPEALAHRLQNETARLVERDAPLFERALDGAIKALDKAA